MNLLDNSRGRWKMIIIHGRSCSVWMCAFSFLSSGPWGNQRGQSPVENRGNMYVPSICPSVHPPLPKPLRGSSRPLRCMDGWTDEWTGLTDLPCILLDCVPFGSLSGHCPAYITTTIMKYQSRARVPMPVSCLWGTGSLLMIQKIYAENEMNNIAGEGREKLKLTQKLSLNLLLLVLEKWMRVA